MKLSGFTFIRNAKKYDFPFKEAVESMLPLIDELVINVGQSEDGTEAYVEELLLAWTAQYPNLAFKILHSIWNDSKTDSGLVLSEQTNIALDACTGDWALYLQADEALHEQDHRAIKDALAHAKNDHTIDGLRFRYLHFYGGYTQVQRPWNWYPSEIRVIRLGRGIRSFGDAQTFRGANDAPLATKLIDAYVYHYGHARHPETMKKKINYFHRFWHGDAHGINTKEAYNKDPLNLVWFWGTHPAPYKSRATLGMEWSPQPKTSLNHIELVAVLARSEEKKGLGMALVNTLSRHHKMVVLTTSVLECVGWRFKKRVALIDLDAGSRAWPFKILTSLLIKFIFPKRVAYVHESENLPKIASRFYGHVSWSSHENAKEGFIVPAQARTVLLTKNLSE